MTIERPKYIEQLMNARDTPTPLTDRMRRAGKIL